MPDERGSDEAELPVVQDPHEGVVVDERFDKGSARLPSSALEFVVLPGRVENHDVVGYAPGVGRLPLELSRHKDVVLVEELNPLANRHRPPGLSGGACTTLAYVLHTSHIATIHPH